MTTVNLRTLLAPNHQGKSSTLTPAMSAMSSAPKFGQLDYGVFTDSEEDFIEPDGDSDGESKAPKVAPDYENLEKYFPFDEMRGLQPVIIEKLKEHLLDPKIRFIMIEAPTGCHAAGTGVLMYDGTSKKVEDIVVGDQIMGPDSRPRKVLFLHRGQEEMVEITPTKGEPFVVNASHILSLQRTRTQKNKRRGSGLVPSREMFTRVDFGGFNPIINIPVKEWMLTSNTFKHIHKLYRSSVDFPEQKLPIDPYILGLWLGDGSHHAVELTTTDYETYSAFRISTKNMLSGGVNSNTLLQLFRDENLMYNKHIPHIYKVSSQEQRLEVIAGLLDSDGHLVHGNFDFIQKRERIARDLVSLARSVGLAAYITECKKKSSYGTEGTYFRVSISGDTDRIPTRIRRKKAQPRRQKKCVLRTGFKAQMLPKDNYYGFEVDQDHLYLTSDFTVHHNCGKSPIALTCARASKSAYVVTANKLLQDQYMRDFHTHMKTLKGRSNYECYQSAGSNCSNAPCQRTKSGKQACAKAAACEYHEAKNAAVEAPIASFNFASALAFLNYIKAFTEQNRNLLVIDETHNTIAQVSNFIEVTFDRDDLLGAGLFKGDLPDYEGVSSYKGIIAEIVEAIKEQEKNDALDKTIQDTIESTKRKLLVYFKLTAGNGIENFVVEKEYEPKQRYLKKIKFKPINVSQVLNDYLFKDHQKIVMMSATILDFETFMSSCGIKQEQTATLQVDSTFPKDRRPIYTNTAVGYINAKSLDSLLPDISKKVDELLDHYKDNKGIIHGHTYKICNYIYENTKHKSRILYPKNSADQKQILQDHVESSRPTVLLSPSMTEGVDLAGDAARVQIIVKTPYPYLGDPVIKRRMDLYPNYYAMQTALTLVQSYGRSIRNEEDWAVTMLLDSSTISFIRQNANIFPRWFLEALA